MTAFIGIMSELIQTHVLTITWGGLINQLTLVFATYIFALGIGAAFTPQKSDPLIKFFYLQLGLSLLGLISPTLLLYLNYHLSSSVSIVLSYFLVAVIGFVSGFELPLLYQLKINQDKGSDQAFEKLMAFDYLGMALGGFLFSNFFLQFLGFWNSVFINSILNAAIGILSLIYFNKEITTKNNLAKYSIGLFILGFGILSLFFEGRITELTRGWIVQ